MITTGRQSSLRKEIKWLFRVYELLKTRCHKRAKGTMRVCEDNFVRSPDLGAEGVPKTRRNSQLQNESHLGHHIEATRVGISIW